ncbi:MAG TPA: ATP-binding protein, partial [Alphaproteobacteria bacterium]|nr:ATP-binding protein [Alphaproteobacteria bacterium]
DSAKGKFWLSEFSKGLLKLSGTPGLPEIEKRIFIEDQAKFLDAFTGMVRDSNFEIAVRIEVKPEYFRWMRWKGGPRRSGEDTHLAGTLQDIHEEYLTQTELKFTQDMLSEAQKIARLGSWQYDIPSDRLFWNEETFSIFGRDISLGPPQGEMQRRYFDSEDFDMLQSKAQTALASGHPYEADLRAIRDDGHQIMVRMIGRPLFDRSGNPYLVVGTIQDITDWMDLRRAHERAEESQRVQNQFLANVSHEIRTPMNAIFGMAQLLLMGKQSPQQAEQTKVILTAARDLLAIINDLLDLARVEAGHMQLENISFDLPEMVREVTVLHGSKIYNKGIEFMIEMDDSLPQMVEGDPLRLKQIIGNLLSNAAKFTKQGQITLTVSSEGQAGQQQIIRFAVTDTGVGISAHRLAHVFEKYVQAEASTAREYGGTGLGLAICRELVELMGGEIHVASDEKSGTRFWFDVALYPLAGEVEKAVPANPLVLEPSAKAAENLMAQFNRIGVRPTIVSHVNNLLPALNEKFTHVIISDSTQYDANNIAASMHHALIKQSERPQLVLLALPTTLTLTSDAFDAITLKPTMAHELRRVLAPVDLTEASKKQKSLRPKVLLVEDNQANQVVLARAIEGLGCEAIIANHGREAVTRVKKGSYALIIMDLQMPVLDGLTAAAELYEYWTSEKKSHTPIVGLTGNAGDQDRAACMAAGMQDMLVKPVMLDDLRAVVQKFIPSLSSSDGPSATKEK